jgi:hypothetical protein
VAIWVKPSSMGLFQVPASKLYGSSVANSWHLSLRKGAACADRFYYETTNGSGYQTITSADKVPKDRWWHVAATWDGSSCTLDTSGCGVCGDGVRNGSEACDGDDLGGDGCNSFGFYGGELRCTAQCTFTTSSCCDISERSELWAPVVRPV